MVNKKLEWEEMYSVGVEEIDSQHKMMFKTINELVDVINTTPTNEKLQAIINQLVQYKKFHFATEEKYFVEFAYEKKDEHIAKHNEFNQKLTELEQKLGNNTLELAYELVDFLEDWLIGHLLTIDHEYIPCFKEHGLK